MGVDIYALKLNRKLSDNIRDESEEIWDNDNIKVVFSLNFSPIKHLVAITKGLYEAEYLDAPDFGMSYSSYNIFREAICNMAHKCNCEEIWCNIENWIGKPFIEFINFADNDGSFDYVIAEKLYKDFESHLDTAKSELHRDHFDSYKTYMEILKIVSDNKGVIYYS